MSSSKNLEKEYDLLSEKVHHLRMALAIETDAAVKFKLEKQIEEAEAEQTRIEQQLEGAEKLSITCPYRGLFAFREQDTEFFFGREFFTDRLVEAVQQTPIVTVIGASGSGKSSVVFAGLVPRLQEQGNWLITSFTPSVNSFHSLAEAFEDLLRDIKAGISPIGKFSRKGPDVQDIIGSMLETQSSASESFLEIKKKVERLRQGEPVLQDIVAQMSRPDVSQASRLLIIADQFEELYTLCRDKELLQRFLQELFSCVGKPCESSETLARLVITLRADFLGKALSEPEFSNIIQDSSTKTPRTFSTKLLIGAMTYQDLKAAIEKPAEKVGLQVEEGLIERILDSIAKEPGNLPLLEFALMLLWNYRSDNTLTTTAYERIGGVEQALACYAESWYNKLTPEKQEQAQRTFVQLVQPGEGTEDTRRAATRTEIGEDNWNFVTTKLTKSRLVITTGSETTEEIAILVHEALIREWQRLQEWLDTNREFRMWQERFRIALHQWEVCKRDDGALLRGILLAEAQEWHERRKPDMSQAERDFFQESLRLKEQEEVKKVEQKHTEEIIRQRNRELALFNQMGNFLQECRTEEETYSVFVSICKELFPSDSGGLYMTDDSQPLFHMVASWGSTPPKSQAFTPDECWALHYDKPLLVKTPEPKSLCPHLCSPPDNGYLCIPIETLDRTLGILHLCFGPRERGYSDDEYRYRLELKRVVVMRVIEQYMLSLANLRLRETLRIESIRDPLTNLYNRRYMEESLEREAYRAKCNHTPLGLIIVDVDHFELFNYEVKELVLQKIGSLLLKCVRAEEIACYHGLNRFLLILPEITLEVTKQRAKELQLEVKDLQIAYQEELIHITISVGVAMLPNQGSSVEDLINVAEAELDLSRDEGNILETGKKAKEH